MSRYWRSSDIYHLTLSRCSTAHLMSGASHNGRENSAGGIIPGKAGLTEPRAVVTHQGSAVLFFTHVGWSCFAGSYGNREEAVPHYHPAALALNCPHPPPRLAVEPFSILMEHTALTRRSSQGTLIRLRAFCKPKLRLGCSYDGPPAQWPAHRMCS